MKSHIVKDIIAILSSIIGIIAISSNKCYFNNDKRKYFILMFLMIIMFDGFFVFNQKAYTYNLGYNKQTYILLSVLLAPILTLTFWIYECLS